MSFFSGRKPQTERNKDDFPSLPALSSSHQPLGFETILGAGSILNGDLKSQTNTRLDGTFEGTLEIDGNILVGETAKITADIHAKNISVAGAVRGNVSGKKVQLLRTARVWGNISATVISTEEGAFIEGKITMLSHDAARPLDPTSLPLPIIPDPNGAEEPILPEDQDKQENADAPDENQGVVSG